MSCGKDRMPVACRPTKTMKFPWIFPMLALLPSLAGAMSVVIAVLWGLGVAVLLMVGAVLHGLIAMWRRRQQPPAAPPGTGRHRQPAQ